MSQSLSADSITELMSGDMVGIRLGSKTTFVHQQLLKSVTDALNDARIDCDGVIENSEEVLGVPDWDAETFQRFIAWLYSHDRGHYMGLYKADALISLYCLACVLNSRTLRVDTLIPLSQMICQGGDLAASFFEAAKTVFVTAEALDGHLYNLRNFRELIHDLTNEFTNTISVDGEDIDSLLRSYDMWAKWSCRVIQNRIIDAIRDGLEKIGKVFTFEQLKKVFENTGNPGAGDPLRGLAVALTYYQRRWMNGPIKPEQELRANQVSHLFKETDGFMDLYLKFEDRHEEDFPGEFAKDPRDREGEMDSCYFHVHVDEESCDLTMEDDDDDE